MCGIAGVLTSEGRAIPRQSLEDMAECIAHRGPDASGFHTDFEAGVHLAHRRLAIVDLSSAGAQPMTSHSGRYTVVLNGEIYNFRDIRAELDAATTPRWRGTSDTEVLLAACDAWGVERTLKHLDGMFAFAIWDREERCLTLARDRMGEKPLFVGVCPDGLVFASELRSIMAYPGFVGEPDDEALDLFLGLSYIPEPRTPFLNVWKIAPGCFAQARPGDRSVRARAYWNAAEEALAARFASQGASAEELLTAIEERLAAVVANQMIADVPLGAFLSGGIDSSLIVALMQRASTKPVRTFTIGFNDETYDEAPFAKAVAQHLGTEHTEVRLDWSDGLDLIARLPEIYDEPFADSSQLPTCLVAQVARRHVTVALSGDGGDEIFGGYNRHSFARRYHKLWSSVPKQLRRPIGSVLQGLAEPDRFSAIEKRLPGVAARRRVRLPAEKLNKLASVLRSPDAQALYLALVRRDEGLIADDVLARVFEGPFAAIRGRGLDLAEEMMLLDTQTYLPGDILAKVDRAAMAVALETRAPFLDHKLFALSWSLPISARIEKGRTKTVLRRLLARHVPDRLIERPKMGFGVPIDTWMRGPLRDWIGDQCASFADRHPRLAPSVRTALERFHGGRGHLHHFLWNVAMYEGWQARTRRGMASAELETRS